MKNWFVVLFILVVVSSCDLNKMSSVDAIVENAIDEKIFPGAVLIVGNADEIVYQKAYGRFTYDKASPKVELNSMFDMASLTKTLATGMCLMKAIDSGLVDPEKAVVDYLPEFNNNGKDIIKVEDLLTHHSGLHSYSKAGKSPEETWEVICSMPMAQDVGNYRYSCLNFITLMKVLESVTHEAMWKFYQDEFTVPMQLERTMFSPPENMKQFCLPTIGDSTGSIIFRQGKVHDPLALSLDGYSGNAGLFSTGPDVAKLCQLMMNKGVYDNNSYVSEKTWKPFATLQDGSRAYAWGVNNYKGSSAGTKMKETAIGHTGYTGTCAWIDREQDIFIVFLTNRVYPMDKKTVTPTRIAVNDAVMHAVLGI